MPDWWTARGVLDTNAVPDDYAVAVVGQLKQFARQAVAEMDANLTGGAGSNLTALIEGFVATSNDHEAVTLGQLKAVGQAFYDRLIGANAIVPGYPWTTNTADDVDYGTANIGQLKNVFNFGVPAP